MHFYGALCCAFAPANIAQEDGKRERTEGVKVLTVFLYFCLFFFLKKKKNKSVVSLHV